MFDKIRRFMGGGRKKKSDAPFKRSDSFRRISIKRHYLERGHAKLPKASTSSASVSKAPLPPDDELVIDYGQWLLKSDEKVPPPPSPRVQITPLEGSPGVTAAHRHRIHVSARPSPATSLDSDLPLTPREVSLGHIWIDHPPVSRTPRSLELPPVSARRLDLPGCSGVERRAHRSLEGGLKAARREEAPPPALPPACGGGSTKTVSSESKDSGFSFSIPRLNPGGGFFRRKAPKPRLSVSRDGYFKRTSEARKSQEAKRSRGRAAGKRLAAAAASGNKGTLDLYQVLRPRSLKHLKLEPMFFVHPEKRKQQNGPRYAVSEIRDPESATYAGNEARKALEKSVPETTYERVGGECTSDEEEDSRCYVPLGVSPVPKRRPVVRRKKSAVRLKYVARPHVARRAPSTLRRRKSTKKSESLCFSRSATCKGLRHRQNSGAAAH